MARTPDTVKDTETRKKAYELFSTVLPDGTRRKIKDICAELDVSQPRVSYWLKADRWLERLRDTDPLPVNPDAELIRSLLRTDLAKHIRTLSGIIETSGHDSTRVKAIAEFARLAKLLGVMELSGADPSTRGTQTYDFEDSLPGRPTDELVEVEPVEEEEPA